MQPIVPKALIELRVVLLLFSEAAAVVRQIAIATAHLHSLNIAHRDLKVGSKRINSNSVYSLKLKM